MPSITRHVEDRVRSHLRTFRVVQISGVRQAGKSTLAEAVAARDRIRITFDDDEVRSRAAQDPFGFLMSLGDGDVLIDEVQRVPEAYLAIKRIVDRDQRKGRFLLTGSSDPLTNRRIADSLAGRIGVIELRPFSHGERIGVVETFVEDVFGDDAPQWGTSPRQAVNDYLDLVVEGGFPEAVGLPSSGRAEWLASFLDTAFARDVRDVVRVEDAGKLRLLFELIAARSGQLVNTASLGRDAGLAANTVRGWMQALALTRLVDVVPAWSGGQRARLVSSPRCHVADSGLLVAASGRDVPGLLRDPVLLGCALETFVVQELLRQASAVGHRRTRLYHYRDRDQREVDAVLEDVDGRVVGIEVKSSTRTGAADASGLRALRARAGERFHRGIVLYCGSLPFAIDDTIHAVPLDNLWRPASGAD